MAFGDSYLTVDEFKVRTRSQSSANDEAIVAVLESASREIDGYCGREFNQNESDEYRFFDVPWYGQRCDVYPLALGDVVSVTEIASDDGTGDYATPWDVDSYVLFPRLAPIKRKPYSDVRPAPLRSFASWPITGYPIRVAGVFGWPEVPSPVRESTFLIANRMKSLWDAPFGISGGGEMGGSLSMGGGASGMAATIQVTLTPIIRGLLNPYRVRTV